MTDNEFNRLKEKVESLKEQRSHAAGALAELMKQLKEEFGLDSLEEAQAEIARLKLRKDKLEARASREYNRIMKKWKTQLESLD